MTWPRGFSGSVVFMRYVALVWESKNIEDQQSEAERQREPPVVRTLTPEQAARAAEREGLKLSRHTHVEHVQTAVTQPSRAPRTHARAHRRPTRGAWRIDCSECAADHWRG